MYTNKPIGKQWRGNTLPPSGCLSLVSLLLIIAGAFLVSIAAYPSLFRVNVLSPRWVVAVMGLFFLSGGIYLVVLSVAVWRRNRQAKDLSRTPEFACQIDYPWLTFGIGDDNANIPGRSLRQAIPLGSFLVPFHVMVVVFIQEVGLAEALFFAFLGLFDLIFLGLVGQAFYWGWQSLQFGKRQVRFGRFPFYLGADLTVTFDGGRKLSDTPLLATLRCIEERPLGGDSPGLDCYEVYCDQRVCTTDTNGQAAVFFPLPADAPETCLSRKIPTYWELIIKAQGTNTGYEGLFLMPIYSRGL